MHFSQFVHDFTAVENLAGHLTYALAITSMIMRSMHWLRFFAILSGLVALVYFGTVRQDYVSAFWEFGYVAVNVVQLFILWYENRASQFDDDETAFVHDALMDLKPVHAAKLLRLATVETVGKDERLLEQGERPRRLSYLLSGDVSVVQDGVAIGTCHRGDFLGEMSFLSDTAANATAVAETPCRILSFDRAELANAMKRREPLRHALHAGVSRNLLAKLNRMNASSVLKRSGLAGA